MALYQHWRDVPEDDWPWPNFIPSEIACRGTGELLVVPAAIDCLQRARDHSGRPFRISSGYRSRLHNAAVGGAPRSSHKLGIAFDISFRRHDKDELIESCRAAGFTGFGLSYKTFLHVDTGRSRQW